MEVTEASGGTKITISPPADRPNAAFGWLVTTCLAAILASIFYSAAASGTFDGAGLAVFLAALIALGMWSLDERFYRRHEVVTDRERTVVRSTGLLGARTRLDGTADDTHAVLVEPPLGLGRASVVVSDASSGRSARLV